MIRSSPAFLGRAEEPQSAGPGILRRGRVVNLRPGVVKEGVVCIGVNAHFAVHAVWLEGEGSWEK